MGIESYQSVKEEIKRSANIVDLISQFVQLKKAGKNYIGLCPFHSEKEPSFTVSNEKQMFHCFGCKKGGDIFAFWMAYHGCSFPEAMKDLAEKYNIPLPEKKLSPQDRKKAVERENIFQINEKAAEYFHNVLQNSREGEKARKYLAERGLSNEIIVEFKIGYAPDNWSGLREFLTRRGLDLRLATRAGLLIEKRNGGFYDRFRDRIIFPIFDLKGRPVGFGGRVLDNGLPKYLNTPETPVFRKSEILYGLNTAYDSIRKAGRVMVVEGYMDLLALKSEGISAVVATLGTALTPEHIRKLKGYTAEIVVIFDSDEAGIKAALRSLPLFLNEGAKGKAVVLPSGHDPDSFIKEKGRDAFLRLVDTAVPMFDFYLAQSIKAHGGSVEEKVQCLKELVTCLSELKEPALRALYVRRVAETLGIKEDIVWDEIKNNRNRRSDPQYTSRLSSKIQGGNSAKRFSRDIHFLNLLIHHPHTLNELLDSDWRVLLSDAVIIHLVEKIFSIYQKDGEFSPNALMDTIEKEEIREELREAMLMPSFYSADTAEFAVKEIKEKIESIKLSLSIQQAKERGDMKELNQLLKLKAKRHQSLG